MSYPNIQSAIGHWVKNETGFSPKTEGAQTAVYWGLYGQGRSCTIEGRLEDIKPLVAYMGREGDLETAARFASLFNAGEAWIKVKPDRGSVCCKVEVDGQSTDEADQDAMEAARKAADDMLESVLSKAIDLLEDYFMLDMYAPDEIRNFSTRHYRVEVTRVTSDEVLDFNLEGHTPSEALEAMREATQIHGKYKAGDFDIRVLYRQDPEDDWDDAVELSSKSYAGHVWATAVGPEYRDLVRECIAEAREIIHSLNFAHKEAA